MNANHRLVYLVGEPGVGKSALLARVTDGWPRHCIVRQPRRELLVDGHHVRAVELGARTGPHHDGFPGTDALPMNAITTVEQWLTSGQAATETPLLLAEGARLGVRRFLDAALSAGWSTHVVLVTSDRAAANRDARGSRQSPTWVKGAITRATRFYEHAAAHTGPDGVAGVHVLDAADLDAATAALRRIAGLEVEPRGERGLRAGGQTDRRPVGTGCAR